MLDMGEGDMEIVPMANLQNGQWGYLPAYCTALKSHGWDIPNLQLQWRNFDSLHTMKNEGKQSYLKSGLM